MCHSGPSMLEQVVFSYNAIKINQSHPIRYIFILLELVHSANKIVNVEFSLYVSGSVQLAEGTTSLALAQAQVLHPLYATITHNTRIQQ